MSIYQEWGFKENPFSVSSLGANEEGKALLVGRDKELKKIKILLSIGEKWTCIDGAIGVGKTSLVNVAVFEQYNEFIANKRGLLIIPCVESFQLSEDISIYDFRRQVLLAVAQTLLLKRCDLSFHTQYFHFSNIDSLDNWLNKPSFSNKGLGLGPISASGGETPNESIGFSENGIEKIIESWLRELFPNGNDGAIVCVIDNMELLQTSIKARKKLEELRDTVLNIHGIKWVLCGANGIIPATSSPRINGFLQTTYKVDSLKPELAKDILNSRILVYQDNAAYYLPFDMEDFEDLYKILNKNLRELLGYIDKYCTWAFLLEEKPTDASSKASLFRTWLLEESLDAEKLARKYATQKIWEVLVKAKEIGGDFSSEDMESLGVSNASNFSQYVKNLDSLGLISISIDDNDSRRKNMHVTPKGYLAIYRTHPIINLGAN
ncbi:MarR family winged helix-turn-helix transcriptional regulator [Janthinobacterium sp. B9-8]|uniref:MarR family winged helix-turn-helix transcriptional regulator n=1 Tax=Janthinobacterium sp. B9-8 TaxID=1236179 RepID=UPI00061CE52C|nr:MarR family winged helix-turn-helix transcriptional regulator [Janthinobacterium sp. B9-8]AMC35269.1 hypothetical protein VN23_11935 [Janthinobacterium sp. B9-8]